MSGAACGWCLLLVDDVPEWRALVALALAQAGCEVVAEADDGQQAVELVAHTPCDAVIMDHVMPVMTGLEAALVIGQRQPSVRIVMLSGTPSGALRRACASAGVVAHYDKADFAQAVECV